MFLFNSMQLVLRKNSILPVLNLVRLNKMINFRQRRKMMENI